MLICRESVKPRYTNSETSETHIVKAVEETERPATLSIWVDWDIVGIAVASSTTHAHLRSSARLLLLNHFWTSGILLLLAVLYMNGQRRIRI